MAENSEAASAASNLEELELIHKKERKELQAKLLGLKKSCAKGDKKKKKEVTEEIARLEAELDQRQEEEVKNFKSSEPSEPSAEEIAEEVESLAIGEEQGQKSRVTKAQKRRDKKAEKEKERETQIAEQEVENKLGPRHREEVRIKEILTSRKLRLFEVPSNGDCLYLSIEHQLKEHGKLEKSVSDLRKLTADYLRSHEDDLRPFTCNPATDCEFSPQEYSDYCNRVENNSSEWGGQLELQALSEALASPIEVLQAEGAPVILGEQFSSKPRITLTYHRHAFGLGEHYNSVTKAIPS